MTPNEEKRELSQEIASIVDGDAPQGLSSALRKAVRLSAMCDELEYHTLFQLHLAGRVPMDGDQAEIEALKSRIRVLPWPKDRVPAWDPIGAWLSDRRLPSGLVSGETVAELEHLLELNQAVRAKLLDAAKMHDTILTTINNEKASRAILDRIAHRLLSFLTLVGSKSLDDRSVALGRPSAQEQAQQLRGLTAKVPDTSSRAYLEEAILCFENRAHRAAIVMSWCLAFATIRAWLFANHRADVNAVMSQWKKPKTISQIEDFEEHAERVVLDTARQANALSKNEHQIFVSLLDQRNTFAHPSGRSVSEAVAEAFIQQVVDEVLVRYL